MGLLDNNIVRLGSKALTITGTATTNSYIGGGDGLFDCKNYSLAVVRFSGLSSGTKICIQGGVDEGFLRSRIWRHLNIYPDYRQQVEFVEVNGTFYCDITNFAQAGFYIVNGSGESITAKVVLMTDGVQDAGVDTMKVLFAEERSASTVSFSGVSVTSGNLKEFGGLSYPYAVVHIKKSSDASMSLYFQYEVGSGSYKQIPVINEKGEIVGNIHNTGTYYVPISGIERVLLSSNSTVSGLTIDVSFQQVNTRPQIFDLKPIQTILSGVETMLADETEKRIAVRTDEYKFLLPFFKFFYVNAVYKNSSDTNVYKTTFKISKFDFMENGNNMWVEELVSVSNRYAVQSDWIKINANTMTIIFGFNAANAGDKLYYEIKGIR